MDSPALWWLRSELLVIGYNAERGIKLTVLTIRNIFPYVN